MSAAELRACKLDSDKASRVRIYDAGEASDQLHAEIVVDATGLSRPQRKELRVRLMVLAQRRGLFVSPHLPAEDFGRAERTQCEMHLPPVQESIRYSGQSSAT
jgi:flavin-dependent dehydrogenase